MTKQEFLNSDLLKNQQHAHKYLYLRNLCVLKEVGSKIVCDICKKQITDRDYVDYGGYCLDCCYEKNSDSIRESKMIDKVFALERQIYGSNPNFDPNRLPDNLE